MFRIFRDEPEVTFLIGLTFCIVSLLFAFVVSRPDCNDPVEKNKVVEGCAFGFERDCLTATNRAPSECHSLAQEHCKYCQ